MSVRLVGHRVPEHRCELPQQSLFSNVLWWTRNPLCVEGNIIQCDECGQKYVWRYYGYSGTWDWEDYYDE